MQIEDLVKNVIHAISGNPTLLMVIGCSYLVYILIKEIVKQITNYHTQVVEDQRKIAQYISTITADKISKTISNEIQNSTLTVSEKIENLNKIVLEEKKLH